MKPSLNALPDRLETPYFRASSGISLKLFWVSGAALLLSACATNAPTPLVAATAVMSAPPAMVAVAGVAPATPAAASSVPVTKPSFFNTPPATGTLPYTVEKIILAGPVIAYVAKINLADPRVKIEVALTDDTDPDGAGPNVGQLTTVSVAAAKHNFHIAVNASFFAAPNARAYLDKNIRYFVGNGAHPVGWHVTNGKIITSPQSDKLRASMLVHRDGKITMRDGVKEIPPDVIYAVSGNAMLLNAAMILPKMTDAVRAPRTAAGISADGTTLLLVAVDGRQTGYSVGASLYELAIMLRDLGANDAVNLDGGGSTAMVLKDEATGVFSLINQPSDGSANKFPQRVERPVIDLIGVRVVKK